MKIQNKFLLSLVVIIIVGLGTVTSIITLNLVPIPHEDSEWIEKGTPEDVGMDPIKLSQINEWIKVKGFPIDSLIIIKSNKLVMDAQLSLDGNLNQLHSQRNPKHMIASCTKSFTSTLIGIAIDKGFIEGTDEKVLDFFPDYIEDMENVNSWKEEMTIEDLLTMRTGLDWWQPGSLSNDYTDPETDSSRLYSSSDYIKYTLNQPMMGPPGVSFSYCGGASHLLSAIIQRTTGRSTLNFANEYLFGPLGITDINWPISPEGVHIGGGSVRMKAIDMAKLGYLFLNNGSWNDEQIVSKNWIRNATKTHHSFGSSDPLGYGYQWWTIPEDGIYFAWGAGCQKIYVIPELDMVVVFTATILNPPDPELGLLYHIFGAINEKETFSKYSFSINYPHGMNPVERTDFMTVSNESGRIDSNSHNYPLYKYTFEWETSEKPTNLVNLISNYISNFKVRNPTISFTIVSEAVTSTTNEHNMVYQEFEMIERGSKFTGVICTWYCEETSKKFIFLYYDLETGLIQNFLKNIETISCH